MKAKELWYAVNGSGQGVVFCSCPERDEKLKIWLGEMMGVYSNIAMQLESEGFIAFPPLTWKDEPVMLEIKAEVCSEGHR